MGVGSRNEPPVYMSQRGAPPSFPLSCSPRFSDCSWGSWQQVRQRKPRARASRESVGVTGPDSSTAPASAPGLGLWGRDGPLTCWALAEERPASALVPGNASLVRSSGPRASAQVPWRLVRAQSAQ